MGAARGASRRRPCTASSRRPRPALRGRPRRRRLRSARGPCRPAPSVEREPARIELGDALAAFRTGARRREELLAALRVPELDGAFAEDERALEGLLVEVLELALEDDQIDRVLLGLLEARRLVGRDLHAVAERALGPPAAAVVSRPCPSSRRRPAQAGSCSLSPHETRDTPRPAIARRWARRRSDSGCRRPWRRGASGNARPRSRSRPSSSTPSAWSAARARSTAAPRSPGRRRAAAASGGTAAHTAIRRLQEPPLPLGQNTTSNASVLFPDPLGPGSRPPACCAEWRCPCRGGCARGPGRWLNRWNAAVLAFCRGSTIARRTRGPCRPERDRCGCRAWRCPRAGLHRRRDRRRCRRRGRGRSPSRRPRRRRRRDRRRSRSRRRGPSRRARR